MRSMKKFALWLAAVVLLGVFSVFPAAADNKYSSLLVLGDSISTGYGLENYTPGGTPYLCRSYANLLAESLSLKGGETYLNRAVNGDASDDLLKLLPSLKDNVEKSELVIISIGGNDLLHIMPKVVTLITGQSVSGLQEAAQAVLNIDGTVLAEGLKKPELLSLVLGAVADYTKNLGSIIALLHEYNPDARVIFLAQYNPMSGLAEAGEFGLFAGTVIDSLNLALISAVAAAGYGYEVADIPSVINVNAKEYTNILDLDIHPSAAGHELMGRYMAETVGNDSVPATTSEETTDVPETTVPETAAPETTATETTATETTPLPESTPEATVAGNDSSPNTEASEKKGCGSALGLAAVLALAAGGVCLMKKRG